MEKPAVFIGRFQPLHKGHLFAIRNIAARHKNVFIVIGSAQKKNEKENPFALAQRKKMIKLALDGEKSRINPQLAKKMQPHAKFCIVSLDDNPSNEKWLDALLSRFPSAPVFYSNNPLVQKLLRSRGVCVKGTGSLRRASYQGKTIRKKMANGQNWQPSVPKKVSELIKKCRKPQ